MKILHSEGNIKQRSFGFSMTMNFVKMKLGNNAQKVQFFFSKVYFPFFCQGFSSVILETQLSAMQKWQGRELRDATRSK